VARLIFDWLYALDSIFRDGDPVNIGSIEHQASLVLDEA
jgi:hypothetical protein